jgi:hypothetical protein
MPRPMIVSLPAILPIAPAAGFRRLERAAQNVVRVVSNPNSQEKAQRGISNPWSIQMAKCMSWSMKEFQHALRMKRQGATCADIALALGRSAVAVEAKLKYCGKARVNVSIAYLIERPTSAVEEQVKRNAAHHRDLTGAICGDPPVGYSALDRKRGLPPATGRDM